MSRHVRVTVPPEDAALVLGALLAVYATQATGVADQAGRDDYALKEARADFEDTSLMLDVFGLERDGRAGPAELVGPASTVCDVLRIALEDAHAAMGDELERYNRAKAGLDDVLGASERAWAALDRFVAFEREHAL